jgi:hypothetical protein
MSKKVFKNFQEFYSLTRPLTSIQRSKLLDSLPANERRRLMQALHAEGWEDLFIRNELDQLVDMIKEDFGEDLILLRVKVLSGNMHKVRKSFWAYVDDVFSSYSMQHKWHILEGIKTIESGNDHFLLVSSRNETNG